MCDYLLHDLAPVPNVGYAIRRDETGALHAVIVAPRAVLEQRSGLRTRFQHALHKHKDAVAWVAPMSTARTGTVWHGHGWFPVTNEGWAQMHDEASRHMFLSDDDISTKRQRTAVSNLQLELEALWTSNHT